MAQHDIYKSQYFIAEYAGADDACGGPVGWYVSAIDGAGIAMGYDIEYSAADFFAEQAMEHLADSEATQIEEFVCVFDEANIVAALSTLDAEYEHVCAEEENDARLQRIYG